MTYEYDMFGKCIYVFELFHAGLVYVYSLLSDLALIPRYGDVFRFGLVKFRVWALFWLSWKL